MGGEAVKTVILRIIGTVLLIYVAVYLEQKWAMALLLTLIAIANELAAIEGKRP